MFVQISDNVSFEEASTLFSGIATVANSLYSHKPGTESLKLSPPWEGGRGKYTGKSILILGGATQVGLFGALWLWRSTQRPSPIKPFLY